MENERRRWLKYAAGVGAAAVLSACERGRVHAEKSTTTTADAGRSPEQVRCDDVAGLSGDEIERRKALKYTDRSSDGNRTCGGCMHLQPVPGSNSPCKRCSVVPGPVHVDGWCSSWTARVSGGIDTRGISA